MFSFFTKRKIANIIKMLYVAIDIPYTYSINKDTAIVKDKFAILCDVLSQRAIAIKYISTSNTMQVTFHTEIRNAGESLLYMKDMCGQYLDQGVFEPSPTAMIPERRISLYDWLVDNNGNSINAITYINELSDCLDGVQLLLKDCKELDRDYLLRKAKAMYDNLLIVTAALYECGQYGVAGGIR